MLLLLLELVLLSSSMSVFISLFIIIKFEIVFSFYKPFFESFQMVQASKFSVLVTRLGLILEDLFIRSSEFYVLYFIFLFFSFLKFMVVVFFHVLSDLIRCSVDSRSVFLRGLRKQNEVAIQKLRTNHLYKRGESQALLSLAGCPASLCG